MFLKISEYFRGIVFSYSFSIYCAANGILCSERDKLNLYRLTYGAKEEKAGDAMNTLRTHTNSYGPTTNTGLGHKKYFPGI